MSAEEEKTPESGQKAIEDTAKAGGSGTPEVATNPFWSDFARSEAALKALRPTSLPREPLEASELARLSPPKEATPGDFQNIVIRSMMEENARLWQRWRR